MKIARVYGKDDLRLEEEETPKVVNVNDVLIKTKRVGICGSDVHLYHGENPLAVLPRVMGHEVVGEVVDIGSNVKNLNRGDHVVVEPIRYCGKCYACRHGMPNVCNDLSVFGVHEDGGMREYLTVPEKQCYVMDKKLDWDTAVLAEPYTIGANATFRGNVGIGDKVLIQGAGPIGICILKLAKIKGAEVMISDVVSEKLEFAKQNGADRVVDVSKEDIKEAVKDWTGGEGVNKVIDAVCTTKTFELGFDVTSPAGTIVVLGFSEDDAQIKQLPITKKQLTVVGSRLQAYQFANVIRLMESGNLKSDGLITHKFKFEEVQKAFDFIDQYPEKVKKMILTFDD
ncbi:zinc-binding alcohol dehydrogenase family protein [Clostridium tyrobutyricum]|jgi:L-gulonate 5-dehydrogenase|uniref:zinc-binding alcohol dehydrogenase family protein n=1 Tax=Clostridium tyrobutyricum TaxID=1519 RepID=UPI001C3874C9|nr:zinc-binding alcohol dehydrogenase family protein [Clostridium tyrobutyricum]MBV4438315.1 zinc-binding alcohol dehydrogenase family protein [Clostridium tyrobutyricum]MBV4440569.1 zinc-binding alcohol dehydrogenase family protein [Clostridium tyrobutyricum]